MPILFRARKHKACTDCGTKKKRHMGLGRCTTCYQRRERKAKKAKK